MWVSGGRCQDAGVIETMLDFRGDGPGQSADLLTESFGTFGFGRGGVEERGDGYGDYGGVLFGLVRIASFVLRLNWLACMVRLVVDVLVK